MDTIIQRKKQVSVLNLRSHSISTVPYGAPWKELTSVRTVGPYRSFGGKTQRSCTQHAILRTTALADWTELSCSLRTISERAAQQHHHGLPGASSQAPCSVILAESVLFYYHNVNPAEICSRLHGRPASRQPAGWPDCSTDWTLRAVFVHNRWTLRGSEPGFGFLGEFWV
jgi:hypothetical protein